MSVAGLEQLGAMETRLDGAAELGARAAARAAPKLLEVARAQWAAGRAPNGEAWPLTEDGRIALTTATARATAHADGAAVVLTLPDELRFHQDAKGARRRQLVPDEGEPLPPDWEHVLEEAWRAEAERIGEGR